MNISCEHPSLPPMAAGKIHYFEPYLEAADSILHIGASGPNPDSDTDWFHTHIDRHADTVVGLEMDETKVERGRQLGYDVRQGNAERFDFDETFDLIIAPDVIEHLQNPGMMFDTLFSHLNQDGTLLINTPHPMTLVYVLSYLKNGTTEDVISSNHTMWFDEPTIAGLAERSGYKLVETESLTWDRESFSQFDRFYLSFRSVLQALGLGEHLFAREQFYIFEKSS